MIGPKENARLTYKDTPGNPGTGQQESLVIPGMLVSLPEENLSASNRFIFHFYTKLKESFLSQRSLKSVLSRELNGAG